MKKILLEGFDASVTEESVRALMDSFGPVHGVEIFRDGNASAPVVLVAMGIDELKVVDVTLRITRYWHQGCVISAHRWVY